jgi:hypothetical protein
MIPIILSKLRGTRNVNHYSAAFLAVTLFLTYQNHRRWKVGKSLVLVKRALKQVPNDGGFHLEDDHFWRWKRFNERADS